MDIYVETYGQAEIAAADAPAEPFTSDGMLESIDGTGARLAVSRRGNPLGDGWTLDIPAGTGRVVAWSGTLGAHLFEPHPRTWMASGREALDALCARLRPELESRGLRLCLHPHARHVLSDPPSTLDFARAWAESPFEVALAPASMLEPSMLDVVEDHLVRAFETLGGCCAMVILTDAAVTDDGAGMRPVPLGEGVLPRGVVRRLLAEHVPASVPRILIPGRLPAQLAWLGLEHAATGPGLSRRPGSG